MLKKINPFRKLDLVVHPASGKRGIVTEVKGQMVTFEVVYPKPQDGQMERVQYSHKHLTLYMPAAMVVEGAKEIQRLQKREKTIIRRAARWVRNFWRSAVAPAKS